MATPALFPVWRELLCDGETPVGVFARLRRARSKPSARGGTVETQGSTGPGQSDGPAQQYPFLLESVLGGQRWARFSIIGVGHRATVRGTWRAGQLHVEAAPGPGFQADLAELCGPRGGFGEGAGAALIEALLARYAAGPDPDLDPEGRRLDPDLPRFWGGLVGVWGHDMVRDLERIPTPDRFASADAATLPAFELLVSDTLVVFDNLSQKVTVFATACPREDGGSVAAARSAAEGRIAAVIETLRADAYPGLTPLVLDERIAAPTPTLAEPWRATRYVDQVVAGKRHIVAGDVFQVVLSQRFDQPRVTPDGHALEPLDVYRMLRVTNPAPYMYLLELPSATLAGASPEVLVRVEREGSDPAAQRRVTVRPIAGTRRRGQTQAEDLALERELLEDPKERAEHLMLIDLGRNDVGRVAAPGTVRVDESHVIERYSRVMHIVSEVSGELAPELGVVDALRSTFPAGTLSGAPKVRALEIIDALEPAPRGWYGGAVGYFGFDGGADFAICIRSVVFCGDTVRVQAGAGIVYDSEPAAEDEECWRKASAVLRAIEMARAARAQVDGGASKP